MTKKTAFSLLCALSLVLLLSSLIAAQIAPATQTKVNIIIDRETVRFAPQETAQELRLLVTDQSGTALYDSGPLPVSLLDWPMRDNGGKAVKGGLYLYTLAIKDAAGELREWRGYLIVNRAGDSDRIYVATGDKVGIGGGDKVSQVTVVGSPEVTVGAAEMPYRAPLTEANGERNSMLRDTAGRSVAEASEPAQQKSAGGGLGGPVRPTSPMIWW